LNAALTVSAVAGIGTMSPMTPSLFMIALADLALAAGREIMTVYAQDFSARTKTDATPVTEADEKAEQVILAGLAELDRATPVISEEAAAGGKIPAVAERFYLVDPLDGTKEFISRNGEFTVNIALVEKGLPVAGVVFAPALNRMFIGEKMRGAAEARTGHAERAAELAWHPLAVRAAPTDCLTVVASRSHRDERTDAFLGGLGKHELVSAGSSLKFCLLASGEADLYPRFGRTMEWDTAAGHAVLLAAGGLVKTEAGCTLGYGKVERGYDNPAFIAASSAALVPAPDKARSTS
jgi:3'(2'), 5'-bisphosphate nucleotidase